MPDNWAWVRQASIITLISGQDFSPDGYNDSQRGIPYITGASNMVDGKVIINRWTENPSSIAIVGDVLITCKGAGVGKMAYMDIAKAHVARQVMAIRPHCNIPSKFIETVLQGQFTKIREQMNGLIPGISRDVMLNLFFPLPPLAEQQRIVEQIETLLGYVDIIDTDAETLEKSITLAKQKILDLAIRGKLVPQDPADEPASELLKKIKAEKDALIKAGKIKKDKHESYIFKSDDNCYYEQLNGKTVDVSEEIPFDLPDSWSWCRFSTLVNFVMGKTPARSQKEFWDMPFLPWVSIADMIPGGVIKKTKEFISSNALSHCFSDRISPAGTLIMSFKLTIGRVSILNMPAQHNEAIISIFPFVDQENIHRDYLLKILPVMVDFVKKSPAIKGNTLNSDSLSKMLIPLPPLAEQERIVSCIAQFETILKKSIQE